MKIKIGVALGVLFALAPMAAPKGRPRSQGLSFFAACDIADTCTVTASGLAASATYILNVADGCNVEVLSTSVNANSSGMLNTILGGVAESYGCNSTGWTFTLSSSGKKSAVVATYFASDSD